MQSSEQFTIDAADIAFRVIALACETALRLRSPAGFRSARSLIEGQLSVIRDLGYDAEPSDDDLARVRRALER